MIRDAVICYIFVRADMLLFGAKTKYIALQVHILARRHHFLNSFSFRFLEVLLVALGSCGALVSEPGYRKPRPATDLVSGIIIEMAQNVGDFCMFCIARPNIRLLRLINGSNCLLI